MATFGNTLDAYALDPTTGLPLPGVELYAWADEAGGAPLLSLLSGLDGSFGWEYDTDADGQWVSAGLTGPRLYVPNNDALATRATTVYVDERIATRATAASLGVVSAKVDTTETRVGTVEDELSGRLSPASVDATVAAAVAPKANTTDVTTALVGKARKVTVEVALPATAATVNAAITEAAASGGYGAVVLPPGRILLDAPIVLRQGVVLQGGGSHDGASRPATDFQPAPGYTGVGFHFPYAAANLWHHGGLRRVRVKGFASHGVFIEGGMGELSVIDDVMSINNGGDGIRIAGSSTPSMLGRVHVGGNTGAGLRLVSQSEGLTQVIYLAGDNNGESLMTVDTANSKTVVQVLAWKAERWSSGFGHPNVFVINNGNGAMIDLGHGRVNVAAPATVGNAVIRQTSSGSVAKVRYQFALNDSTGTGGYTYGYQDTLNAVTRTVASTIDRENRVGDILVFTAKDTPNRAQLAEFPGGPSFGAGTDDPAWGAVGNTGSLYARNTGSLYYKGASAWLPLATVAGLKTSAYATASRPSASTAGAGSIIFDSTLAMPLFSDGSVWRKADGTAA